MNDHDRTGLEIAVIGMACRFPGAQNFHEYWENLKNGVETVTFFSSEELIEAGVDPKLLDNPYYVKAWGIIEDPDYFDAAFFNYTPKDAMLLDPQVRIFHECVYEALENAGYAPESYDGLIGLYAGDSMNLEGIQKLLTAPSTQDQFQIMLFNETNYLCTLTSYKLNLRGPSLTVQTACSTALVAIHLACQSLLSGECDIALAGGVSIAVPQKTGYLYSPEMVFSPDGHCRAFDAKAAGTYFSDGAGVVVLKPLEEALADRDSIYAVIKGTAINNDGASKAGFSAPSVNGQTRVLKTAYEVAGVSPESIGYIEAHGTGTALGDPMEIEALKRAFNTGKRGFCKIGSVKTNFGHTYTAAGIASFIKTVLALKHKKIPPSLHFETPNPKIDFENSPFVVNTELCEWSNGSSPRRAGVNSCGIGGTNAHIVLEETPAPSDSSPGRPWQLLLLSAKTETALEKQSQNLAEYLKKNPDTNLADVAYTLHVGRTHFPFRRKVLCSTVNEGITALLKASDDRASGYLGPLQEENPPSVIFMFAGQGSQYVNMGLELYQQERIFQEELDRYFALLQPFFDYNPKELLYPNALQETETKEQLNQTAVAQPLIFMIEYALAKLLLNWGIQPEAMIGYSFGEYVAACLSGVLSLEDALKLIAMRGKLMNRLPNGAMLSVPLPEEEVSPLLNGELSLAIVNGPSCIVAGSEDAIAAFEKQMQQKRYMCMRVSLSFAAHSAEMETIVTEFEEYVKQATLREPQIPYISSSTGTWIAKKQATDPKYWARHLRDTIRFSAGIEKIIAEIPRSIFVEIGPGRDLSVLINRFIKNDPQQRIFTTLRNVQRDVSDVYFLLNQLGRLWGVGVPIDWNNFHSDESRRRIPLPTYPFERQRYAIAPIAQPVWQVQPERPEIPKLYKNPDISDWFYVPTWKHSDIPEQDRMTSPASLEVHTWLVFADEYGLGHQLTNRLKQQNQNVFLVEIGTRFAKLDEHSYTIQPDQQEDYATLLDELLTTGSVPDRIIHVWSVTPDSDAKLEYESVEKAQELGFYSLIFLAQALDQQKMYEEIRISVVSSNIQHVTREETLSPQKATILGPVKVIPQEYPHIRCCHIDITLSEVESQQERLINQLVGELTTLSSDVVIAYREGKRWVQTFESVHLSKPTGKIPKLREHGVYLITGGLGKIGLTLSEFLAQTVKAKLILTGRSVFPARDTWDNWLATHAEKDSISEKIKKIRHLEELGTEVLVASADVSNLEHMHKVIELAEKLFSPVNGIIHAAGIVDERAFCPLAEITSTECEQHFLPKLYGTLVLEKVMQTRELDFCLLISSISSILGGLGFVAYTAANLFMDTFVYHHEDDVQNGWVSLNWDTWKFEQESESGSIGATLAKLAMTGSEAVKTFQYSLSLSDIPQLIVSTVDLQLRIQQALHPQSRPQRSGIPGQRATEVPYIAPRNEIEQQVVKIFEQTLGYNQIGVKEDFFDLGGDSLKAVNIVQGIRRELDQEIQLKTIFDYPTVEALAALLTDAEQVVEKIVYPSIVLDTENFYEPFPLTDVQTAYLLGRSPDLEMGNIATHAYMEIEITLDIQRLRRAFQKVIQHHPMMRVVVMENGQQKILPEVPEYEIVVKDLTHLTPDAQQERLRQEREVRSHKIFPAGQWPMFEWKAFKLSKTTHWLTVNVDFLITDAASFQIFENDLMRWYQEPDLEVPALQISFRDYVLAYREFKNSEIYARDKAFWHQKLQDFPSAPALPLRCHPSEVKNPHFRRLQRILGTEEWTAFKRIAQEHGITPSALLCTAYAIVLSSWSNQRDLAINLTVFNRYPFHDDVDKIVGDFTSIIILDLHFTPNETFWQRAKNVQSTMFAALDHRHYDGVEFVRDLARHQGLGSQAVIPLIFTSMLFEEIARPDEGVNHLGEVKRIISQTSQVFIDHQTGLLNGQLVLTWDYVEELFDPKSIEAMFHQYVGVVTDIIRGETNPTLKSSSKLQTLLSQYNATFQAIPPTLLHRLFQQQAEATPEAIALEHDTATMSYEELDKQSNQVAWCLRQKYGIGKNDYVGVLTARSMETIVYVLGILKAGGAYVPIDPEYPENRRTYIFDNSQCKLLLESDFYHTEKLAEAPTDDMEIVNTPEDVAYIIYTSGSTGRPKGVIITHQAVTNTILNINQRFNVTAKDKILGISSMCFDLSVYDVFGALSTGATLVLIDDQRDIKQIFEALQMHHITIWNSVPAIMEQVVKMAEKRAFHTPKEDTAVVDSPGVTVRQTSDLQPQQYWWSPVVHWIKKEKAIYINEQAYTRIALEVFPELYFFTLTGATLEAIIQKFSEVNAEALRKLLQTLIEQNVLVNTILPPEEVFTSQYRLFNNTYSEEILYVAEAAEKFKQQQLKRMYPQYNQRTIPLLQSTPFPEYIQQRYSCRTFDSRPIPFRAFSQLLAIFRQRQQADGSIRYYYASAGGLYPIDIFIHVKRDRVESMTEGLYYYNPQENSLHLVCDQAAITRDAHYFLNKDIFDASACSLFFVYNADVTMPKYQSNGYFYACIDSGIMVGTLTQAAEPLGIGLCSIGSLNFSLIREYFQLNDNQVLLHTVEMGLKNDLEQTTLEQLLPETEDMVSLPTSGNNTAERNTCLRLVLLSGDWIPLTLPGKIKTYFPNSEIISLGGATEASIWSIYYPIIGINKHWTSIPYGMPLANQEFYVLNYEIQPCPIGVEGDLYIGGVGLASGYFNDDEKTRSAFITHPVFGRLYRTGDRGIFHEEGYIEFRGRKDQQVKIRGYRIELGEIESQLLAHPAIAEAVVLVKTDEPTQEKYLCAYYTMKSWETRQKNAVPVAELREHLLHGLPEYMIPTYFVPLANMPLTPNGKIDVKALSAAQQTISTPTTTYVAPVTSSEKLIAESLKKILNLEEIGTRHNFFDLGATSVHMIELNNKLSEQFEKNIPVSIYFRYPTIEALAQYLTPDETSTESGDRQAEQMRKAKNKFKRVVQKKKTS